MTEEITLGQLAAAYHVAPRTILRWLKEGFPEGKIQAITDQYDGKTPEASIVALRVHRPDQ